MPRDRHPSATAFAAVQFDYVAAISQAAVLFGFGGREIWVPISQIFENDVPTDRSSEPCEVNVAAWFAKKEGLR